MKFFFFNFLEKSLNTPKTRKSWEGVPPFFGVLGKRRAFALKKNSVSDPRPQILGFFTNHGKPTGKFHFLKSENAQFMSNFDPPARETPRYCMCTKVWTRKIIKVACFRYTPITRSPPPGI